ncbi:hypothetical protein [Methylorubrum extorquens]|uniref:Uncharacterized protein n=1 Tax=Methylorubrum extorquens (strain CM4 / NCIMB 13688) TaxID=440085 RepID=B7KXQ0_METC4|nr:hypothetical protein [Methylorubrum extorquens]ACK84652.1 hypothetical protein Mchl_3836 [Methylorubrum extorquens CM4]
MRVYVIFGGDGLATDRFFDEVSHPPVTETVRVKPEGAADDLTESEWPQVERFVRRNDAIPAEAVEISEADRAAIVSAPQFHRWGRTQLTAMAIPASTLAVPPIADRQFARALAPAGSITEAEVEAWVGPGEIPAAMEAALSLIPDAGGQRFGARMMLRGATTFERCHPLTEQLGALLGYDAAALDALWTRAAAL